MERLTDCAQGYCEMYCKEYGRCFDEPVNCAFHNEVKLYEALKSIEGIVPLERLLELADADRHGRLVVLPCKVGDTIWRIKCFADWPDIGKPYVEADAFLYRDIHYFGKTVFLSREEAEAALSNANKIPCKHGLSRHRNEIREDEVYCELNAKWMNVSLGDCLGNCESEAAPDGKGGEV